ncbi:MAG: bifunctional 4-hydroxy-2-oxoglutarate aldolase/2-dehydro-3-deoxy-phosphogluconate aldolase [Clostridia bacterium]|nr:bifunctional 2-keto-4-hydroxyglutarate aldolase/2-keto-3-deoxy-6-phosphogluconate aldolase [Eubacteriales bacterium]MDD3867197.1 bifunctional 2-keto-4-hydroxyglutarate aldolase/2-keto-3-deoxy-6-phosphogluconate aldolase [Eubacteriales bacterium]MDD4461331.1 bifunctional 2-keto-4-hydroxyglutarate aldolase/2-keto-3-deoxy-6-phosphogluconate aldolase [Eubacteriales bacterium]NCC47840.1 bifunctional 4-hydroxy-2-oxoglutarate aldolase/2-dehydro-3-deoxy-phosphogluconate aldolase [Clostridia bacterium
MNRREIVDKIERDGLVAVVRAESADQAIRISEACIEGGVAAIELTYTVPGANAIIEQLAGRYKPEEIIVGAGTVLDSVTARMAILSGAKYVVSPALDEGVTQMCQTYQIAVMPGAMTLKEMIDAMRAGADIVKMFPGDILGPAMIKAAHGPLPQLRIMPTGGVDVNNAAAWIKAGAVALGAGSSLTGGAKTGDYAKITETAKRFIEQIKLARGQA